MTCLLEELLHVFFFIAGGVHSCGVSLIGGFGDAGYLSVFIPVVDED